MQKNTQSAVVKLNLIIIVSTGEESIWSRFTSFSFFLNIFSCFYYLFFFLFFFKLMEANPLFDDMGLIVVVFFLFQNCSYPKAYYEESLLEECGTGTTS